MSSPSIARCDGCGQAASPEHVARRLKRLEWATRYRPVHIHTLFLGAASPDANAEFLYSPGDEFQGEAAALLEVAGIAAAGKSADTVLVEFQRRGYFLTHVLECPFEQGINSSPSLADLLKQRAAAVATRIRRSLKPKRLAVLGARMGTLAAEWSDGELGCPLLLNDGKPYRLEGAGAHQNLALLRAALESPVPTL